MPELEPWTLIATDAPVERLLGTAVVLSVRRAGAYAALLLRVKELKGASRVWAPTRLRVKCAPLGEAKRPLRVTVPRWLRLDDLVTERLGGGTIEHVLVVPGARWGDDKLFGEDVTTAARHAPGSDDVYDASQILARLGSQPGAGDPDDDHSPSAARARVGRVKEKLGRMTTDVIYRIENSALFDTSVPLTRQFTLLMMRWDDEEGSLGAAALDRLSFEVQLAFDTARDHAETVGLSHLPSTARPDARRALKAARLADRAASKGEREAALLQVTRLLDSIALYYLPAPSDVPRMIGGSAPQVGAG